MRSWVADLLSVFASRVLRMSVQMRGNANTTTDTVQVKAQEEVMRYPDSFARR